MTMKNATELDRTKRPPLYTPTPAPLPELRTVMLDNGIPLKIYDRPDMGLVNIAAINRGGLAEAKTPQTAIIAAEMRRFGSGTFSAEEIAKQLDINGAWLKTTVSSHYTSSNFFMLADRAKAVLPIAAEIVMHPVFPEHETKIIANRKAEEREIAQTTEMFKVNARSAELAYGKNHPLAKEVYADDFRSVKPEELSEFFNLTQHPANLCLYAFGRITPEIESQINRAFGTIPESEPVTPLNIIPFAPQAKGYYKHIPVADSSQSALSVTIPTIGRSHPDYLALRLAVMALGGYFGSRLSMNIREEKGMTYGVRAALLGFSEGSTAVITTQCDASYIKPVREEIRKEIERLATVSLTPEELERLRLAEIGTLIDTTDSPDTIIGFHQTIHTSALPQDYFNRRIDAVNAIDSDTIMRVAAEHLTPSDAITISAGLPL